MALQPTKLWLGNVRHGTSDVAIRELLAESGFDGVLDVIVRHTAPTQDSFAFVTFQTEEVISTIVLYIIKQLKLILTLNCI